MTSRGFALRLPHSWHPNTQRFTSRRRFGHQYTLAIPANVCVELASIRPTPNRDKPSAPSMREQEVGSHDDLPVS